MNRPNLSTSPKAVQAYVANLERQVAESKALASRLYDGIQTDQVAHDVAGRVVAFTNVYDTPPTPLARLREQVHFTPDQDTHFQVRWVDDGGYLEVASVHRRGQTSLVMRPQAANVIHLLGPR